MSSYTTSNYSFNQIDRIGTDVTANTQHKIQNTKFANYNLTSYFSETMSQDSIRFASQQPTMFLNGIVNGQGLNGHIVDYDSNLHINTQQDRSLEKLNLKQRIFLTVPYLGRGACDPSLELKLQQGDIVIEKKREHRDSNISDINQDFIGYVTDKKMVSQVEEFKTEDVIFPGWIRGGSDTRYREK
jgi:hypothetical protein